MALPGGNHTSAVPRAAGLVAALACVLCLALAVSLAGCKSSDRLTEVVYDQEYDDVDYDNPSKILIQDPTAEETTDELPMVEQADDERDDTEEEDPEEDDEDNTDDEAAAADVSQGTGSGYSTTAGGVIVAGDGTGGEGSDSDSGTGTDGDADSSGGDAEGEGEGDSEGGEAIGGTGGARSGGNVTYYASVGANQEVPTGIDYVAACGEAATIVSMLAGDAGALLYTDATWASRSKIKKVLGDKYNTSVTAAWSDDGDSYDLSASMLKKMIADDRLECVYVMSGDKTLKSAQQEKLEAAGIVVQVLPDMTTPDNICETVSWIGRTLAAGDNQNTSAQKLAEAYVSFHDDVVEECADAASTPTDNSDTGTPVTSSSTQYYTLYVSDWIDNVSYIGSSADLTMKYGIGVTTVGSDWSPLYWYMSIGGAYCTASTTKNPGVYTSGTTLVWQFNTNQLSMKSGDFSKKSLVANYWKNSGNTAYGWTYLCSSSDYIGFGTELFPIVICDTQASAEKMQNDRELGEGDDDVNTLYELYPLVSGGTENVTYTWVGLKGKSSTMCYAVGGLTTRQESGQNNAYISAALAASSRGYSIVANPEGLFGESWADGSVESVLETAWIAGLYHSDSLKSTYVAQTISDFYAEFYGYSLSSSEIEEILAGAEE